jgi:hypothetical protein
MKNNVSRIFNRTKLYNNLLFHDRVRNARTHALATPNILSKLALDDLTDNLGIMRKTFD